jgi:hypothetical protein
MDYCQPVIEGSVQDGIRTFYFCDWNGVLYSTASDCYSQCSALLISRSDAQSIILLVFSLFVLFVVVLLFKLVVD